MAFSDSDRARVTEMVNSMQIDPIKYELHKN